MRALSELQVGHLQLLLAVLIAVLWPIYDHFIDWPRFQRELRDNPRYARLREYRWWILLQWVVSASGALLWLAGSGAQAGLGLNAFSGWRLWASVAFLAPFVIVHSINLVKAFRSERTRSYLRAHLQNVEAILPRTTTELIWFLALSVTAGVCEEFLFRGYLVWVFAPLLTRWGAVVLSTVAFGFLHAYQGRKGMIQATVLGALFAALVLMARSLVPAMLLHAVIDIGSGLMTWIALTTPIRSRGGDSAASAAV